MSALSNEVIEATIVSITSGKSKRGANGRFERRTFENLTPVVSIVPVEVIEAAKEVECVEVIDIPEVAPAPVVSKSRRTRVRLNRTEKPVTIVTYAEVVDSPLSARIFTSRVAAIDFCVDMFGISEEQKYEARLNDAIAIAVSNGGSLSVQTVAPTQEFTI